MITTVLTAPTDPGVDRVAEIAVRFANSLVGGPPDHLLTPDHPRVADVLMESDVIVVASPVSDGSLDSRLRRELDCFRHGLKLAGLVAFAVAVGSWPTDGDVAELQMRPLLQTAGAACAAPGLNVTESPDAMRTIATYCRYWRPAVPALVRLAKRTSSVTGPEHVEAGLPPRHGLVGAHRHAAHAPVAPPPGHREERLSPMGSSPRRDGA